MIRDHARLAQLFNQPELRTLMDRLRTRLRFGNDLYAPLSLTNLSADERSVIDRLLGRKPSIGTSISVRPREIERILCAAQICDTLHEAITQQFGTISNERADRELMRHTWRELQKKVDRLYCNVPDYQTWLTRIFSAGSIKRWSQNDPAVAEQMLLSALALLRGTPWSFIPLADLATRLTGDSHALDRGTRLARLCLSAIESQCPPDCEKLSHRQLWEWAGVVMDELSAPVLMLNLRADPDTLMGRVINSMADAGEPCHLSVRFLRSTDAKTFSKMSGQVVYACENPSVVASAAQAFGSNCKPLICTAGQPATAAQLLLSILRQAGCRVRYHGDFDPSGIIIANYLIQRFNIEPWRMTASDYAAAPTDGPTIKGLCAPATWDSELAPLIESRHHSVLEERLLDVLLKDLSPK